MVSQGQTCWSSSGLEEALPISRHIRALGRHNNLKYTSSDMYGSPGLLGNDQLRSEWFWSGVSLVTPVTAPLVNWSDSDSDWLNCATPQATADVLSGFHVTHCHLRVWTTWLVAFTAMVAAGGTVAGLVLFATMVALLARALLTNLSQCFLHKTGLCCHSCVLCGPVCHGRGFVYSDLRLVSDCFHCLHLDEWGDQGEGGIILEHLFPRACTALLASKYLSTCLSNASSSTAVLIWLKMPCVPQHHTLQHILNHGHWEL